MLGMPRCKTFTEYYKDWLFFPCEEPFLEKIRFITILSVYLIFKDRDFVKNKIRGFFLKQSIFPWDFYFLENWFKYPRAAGALSLLHAMLSALQPSCVGKPPETPCTSNAPHTCAGRTGGSLDFWKTWGSQGMDSARKWGHPALISKRPLISFQHPVTLWTPLFSTHRNPIRAVQRASKKDELKQLWFFLKKTLSAQDFKVLSHSWHA